MNSGQIIFLNGPSSAGKSTLAKAIQQQIDQPFWHVASDQFVAAQMLPARHAEGGDFAWHVMRPRFFRAFHRCLPAIAGAEQNVIVDHVIEFEAWLYELVDLLAPYDVFFVGVYCPLEELERRERLRGDRMPGEARDHLQVVHSFAAYDATVDTSVATPAVHAADVIRAWHGRRAAGVFQQLYTSRHR
ncbi:MAG TPA: AAA family ATPase [Roseiflexaceae bacterium]|nr:AAA family ATPase [Roseiflexaceae bacterium]